MHQTNRLARKKLLILNGSHSEIPLIQAGKKLGFNVLTAGNNPTLPAHSFADEYHNVDFSDYGAILDLAKAQKIDAICSCANDFGAITSSYVAESLGLPGHDSYEVCLTIHHKDRFKEFSESIDLPTPTAESFSSYPEAKASKQNFSLPVLVKPIDLTGGKGISRIDNESQFETAVETALNRSPSSRIVIEEFYEGTQHSFSTFLVDKKVVLSFSDDELSYLNPWLVSTSRAPAANINQFRHELELCAEKVAENLNLVDGVLHFQYLASPDEFKIIEITRRCSGDLYPIPVELATGVNWAEWLVRAETGMKCKTIPRANQAGFCGRHCIMGEQNGIVRNVLISGELEPNIVQRFMWWKPGDEIGDHMSYKAGVLILSFETEEEMITKTENINELVRLVID